MKKAITFVICSIVMGTVLVLALFLGIVAIPKDVFKDNYTNTLNAKYETLINTDSPKIIIITGSSAAFGLDGNRLADLTGMNVANTAIHAGMGALYETEKIEMYQYVPPRKYKDILGYLFTYANIKRVYAGGNSRVYSRAAFSENGNTMEIQRVDSPIISAYEEHPEHYDRINFENPIIPDSTVKYLKEYKEYVENKGAALYWIGCPTYEAAVQCDYSELQKAANQVEEQIGIPFISNPVDYVFPGEYMYDTVYHTNTRGMEYRTEILFEDLKRAGII